MKETRKQKTPRRAVVSWSGGKDAAWALHTLRGKGSLEVVGLLTTLSEEDGCVPIHEVPDHRIAAQAHAAGLPLHRVWLPPSCPNHLYQRCVLEGLERLRQDYDVSHIVFGDLFLKDIRAFREAMLLPAGFQPVFPLWGAPTDRLAHEMLAGGLCARVVRVDPARLPLALQGRRFDADFLRDLPEGTDPCGENGEFHTFAYDGPPFLSAVPD